MNTALFSKFSPIKKKPINTTTLFGSPVNFSGFETPEKRVQRNSSQFQRSSGKGDFSFDTDQDEKGIALKQSFKL